MTKNPLVRNSLLVQKHKNRGPLGYPSGTPILYFSETVPPATSRHDAAIVVRL